MDPAAVLHVLVKVDGIAREHQKVREFDDGMAAAAATADKMDREITDLDGTLSKAARTTGTASKALGDLNGEMRTAAEAHKRASAAAGDSERQHRRLGATWARVSSAARDMADRLRGVGDGGRDGGGGIGRFVDSMGDLPGRIYVSTRLLGALGNALLLIAPLAIAAGAAVFAIVSALGPLVGLGAAAAGGLFSLAQGFGVLKLATAGIGGALAEQIAAQSGAGAAAVKSAGQQRAAAQAIAAAQDGVRNAREGVRQASLRLQEAIGGEDDASRRLVEAQRTAKRAQEALTDARRSARMELTDLKDRVGDLALAEEQGINKLHQLRKELASMSPTVPDDDLEKRELILDIADAERGLIDVRRDRVRAARELSETERKGIAGSDQVVAAQERIRDADRGVIEAKRGVQDAERATAEARRDMANASREVTKAIQAVRDAQLDARDSAVAAAAASANLNDKFNDLPPAAQAFVRVLTGLKPKMDELRATAAQGLFPGVTSGLQAAMGSFDSVKTVVGQTAGEMGKLADRAGNLVGSSAFGKDIETIGGRNAKILGSFGRSGLYLADALRHVLVAAGPLTTWMANVIEKWSKGAAEAAKAGRESGKLADFFDKTRERAQLLGSIIANLATGLFGMGKASEKTGVAMLKDVDGLTERFSKWANSVKGRNEIAAFMDKVRDAMKAIGPALGALIGAFAHFATTVLPAYARVAQFLAPVLDELVTIFIAWKIAATGAAIATGVWTAVQWLWNAAMAANPLVLVIAGIVAFVAAVVLAWQHSETFRNIVIGAWSAIKQAALDVWGFLGPYLTGWWTVVTTVVTTYVNTWLTVVTTVWNAISAVASAVWGPLQTYFETWWTVVSGVIGFWLNAWKTALSAAWDAIKTVATGAWGAIKTVLSTAWSVIHGAAVWWFNLIKGVVSGVWTAISTAATIAWGGIRTVLTGVWSGIKTAADTGWGLIKAAIINPVRDAASWVLGRFNDLKGWLFGEDGVTGKMLTAMASFGEGLKDKLEGAFKGAANGVIGFVNKIIDAINLIPGVPNIKHIAKLAEGGTFGGGKPAGGTGNAGMKPAGLARGGAFARTGGLVTAPITMMGEEAPRHPEFVIPTNPAYRRRAQMLAMTAAQAVGLAKGGMYSQKDMEHLWKSQGGGDVKIAGAVGMAESGGDPNAGRHHPYHGLWQVGPGGSFDPVENARQAIAKWRAGGASVDARWKPWEAYTGPDGVGSDGPWRKFAGGDGFFDKVGNAIGDAAGAVGGVLGDLLAAGPKFILDKLPNPADMLPPWLRGTGDYVIDKVSAWIRDKVASIVGAGGNGEGPGGGHVSGTLKIAQRVADMFGLSISSTWRSPAHNAAVGGVPNSLHTHGSMDNPGAVDLVGARIMDALAWSKEHLKLQEALVHDVGSGLHLHMGFFRKGGMWGGDGASVLGSYAQGTPFVPQTGPYVLHRGERVVPAAQNAAPAPVHVRVFIGEQELTDIVRVEVDQRDRATAAAYGAGVLPG